MNRWVLWLFVAVNQIKGGASWYRSIFAQFIHDYGGKQILLCATGILNENWG